MRDADEESKRSLRLRIGAERRALATPEREVASARIAEHVLGMPEFASAGRVAAYAALSDEVSLDQVIATVLDSGRPLLLPRVDGRKLVFSRVDDLGALRVGTFGVREPSRGVAETAWEPGDLVLVPGVAFDRHGGRLGRGAGFYDRALPRGADAPCVVGVCFDRQLIDAVPMAPHDRRVDAVVTESGVVRRRPRDRRADQG